MTARIDAPRLRVGYEAIGSRCLAADPGSDRAK